jgi:hypothetical protein
VKRKDLNAKRGKCATAGAADAPSGPGDDGGDDDLTDYLQATLSMIEGRCLDRSETEGHIERWREQLRQHRLEKSEKPRKLPDD